jgi:HSP20 family molecular chaperone IbpA
MSKEKKSFFERLTGTVRLDDDGMDAHSAHLAVKNGNGGHSNHKTLHHGALPKDFSDDWSRETEREGELTVDVYQTPEMIIIKTMVAGVHPEDLDINISRDMVTIRGRREEERTAGAKDDDYFVRELYWGSFSRTITLPEEIDVDESEAIEKHGLLILKLPKLDKKRQSKLKVRTI